MQSLKIDPILISLLIFLAGLLLGRIWGYYKYRDRINYVIKKQRSSSSYVLGLSNLIAGERDLAITELARAAKTDTDRIELYILLGNLYREKGRIDKAIQIHRSVLHRKDLSFIDKEMTEISMGVDFLKAGLIKRARDTFKEILAREPENIEALKLLQRTYEEEREWKLAYETRQRIMQLTKSKDYRISAFILSEWGIDKFREGDYESAAAIFQDAIELDKSIYPAYEFLGKTYISMKQLRKAAETWENMIEITPEKAFLILDELYKVYKTLGTENIMDKYIEYLLLKNKNDWRTLLFNADVLIERGDITGAFEKLFSALEINRTSLLLHRRIWKLFMEQGFEIRDIKKYLKKTEDILFSDPFICVKCHYTISEFKRRCPHCRSWDTLIEERY